jgi:ammonia channel protein AmtB
VPARRYQPRSTEFEEVEVDSVPFQVLLFVLVIALVFTYIMIAIMMATFRIRNASEKLSQRLDDIYDLMKKQHDNP